MADEPEGTDRQGTHRRPYRPARFGQPWRCEAGRKRRERTADRLWPGLPRVLRTRGPSSVLAALRRDQGYAGRRYQTRDRDECRESPRGFGCSTAKAEEEEVMYGDSNS